MIGCLARALVFAFWSLGYLLVALHYALSGGATSVATRLVIRDQQEPLESVESQGVFSQSVSLALSDEDVDFARRSMKPEVWVLFSSTYDAAIDLSQRNRRLCKSLEIAQSILVQGTNLAVISSILLATILVASQDIAEIGK